MVSKGLNQSCIVCEEHKGALIEEIGGDSWKASPDCKETHCKPDAQRQTGATWSRGAQLWGGQGELQDTGDDNGEMRPCRQRDNHQNEKVRVSKERKVGNN